MLLRAGEVLQEVAEALRGHDAQVEPEALLRHDRRLRVAVRDDLEHARQRREERGQRCRVGRGRDHVEVSEALAPAAHAAGLGHLDGHRVRAKRLDHVANDRQPDPEQAPPRRIVSHPLLERRQDLHLAPLAQPLEVTQATLVRGSAQLGQAGHSELAPDPRGRLRPEPGQPQEDGHLARDLGAPLRERVHLAVLDRLDDLRLDRLADPLELGRLPVDRQLGDRDARLADAGGRRAVGADAKAVLAQDLREIRQQLQLARKRVVWRQPAGHASILGRGLRPGPCLPPG